MCSLFSIFTGGLMYGWIPLETIFKDEGVYKELCVNEDVNFI